MLPSVGRHYGALKSYVSHERHYGALKSYVVHDADIVLPLLLGPAWKNFARAYCNTHVVGNNIGNMIAVHLWYVRKHM